MAFVLPQDLPLPLRVSLRKLPEGQENAMALYPTYPLHTERLTLRPFTRGDVDGVFAYRRLDEVARYLFDHPLSREECALAVQQRITQTGLAEVDDKIILAVELSETGALIGEVSLIWRSVEARQGEVGWIFDPGYQGKGFATEAANFMLDLAFGPGDMHRVSARCDVRNEASWRLMERLGMRRDPAMDFDHPGIPDESPLKPHVTYWLDDPR